MPVDEAALGANRLLALLPAAVGHDLARLLVLRDFGFGELVFRQGAVAEELVFPIGGVFSLVNFMEDGRGAEVATVGNEGLVGLGELLRPGEPQPQRAIAQIAGDGLVARADALLAAMREHDALHAVVLGYAQVLMAQIAQSSVCNRLHSVEQRCIRWLLQSHDRVGRDTFKLTQEFLGLMLGVGRQTVNATARKLQDADLIRYARGTLTIRDRPRLESLSCECYARVRDEYDRFLGPPGARTP